MIAFIINGKSFGNCVDYVTRRALEEKLYDEQSKRQKSDERMFEADGGADIVDHLSKDWQLLAATADVRIYEGRKAMADDIARPTRRRKPIKDPVGHISLDFHPNDAPRMTDELMAEVAQDYMTQMGLQDTPYIVVRHNDKRHPHCHIVFSRVDNAGKILTQTTNYKRNERVCKALNRKYRLTQGKSKLNTDVSKLRGKEKVRYQLVNDVAGVFVNPAVKSWAAFVVCLYENGIGVKEKVGKSGRTNLYYCVGKHEFWYKKLDPYLSRENLEQKFKERREKLNPAPQPKPSEPPQRPQQAKPPQAAASQPQASGIRLSTPSLGTNAPEEQGSAHSGGAPDDFKHFLEMHPGMGIEEALHRYRDQQRAKQRTKGPRLHH